MWRRVAAVQTVASRLSSELWEELAVQSPETTIYSASTNRDKGRRDVREMAWGDQAADTIMEHKPFPKVGNTYNTLCKFKLHNN